MKLLLLVTSLLILVPTVVLPARMENLGAITPKTVDDFQRVIDTRCTVCHTRERVDIAIQKRRALEKLQQEMIERGAILNERDKDVLGTFWGSPFPQPPAGK